MSDPRPTLDRPQDKTLDRPPDKPFSSQDKTIQWTQSPGDSGASDMGDHHLVHLTSPSLDSDHVAKHDEKYDDDDVSAFGSVCSRYRITDATLGQGGFARVAEAKDHQGHFFAIKKQPRKFFGAINAELTASAKVGDHPNIMPIFRTFMDDNSFYMVMPRMHHTLRFLMYHPSVSIKQVAKHILKALQMAHSQKIMHRDLKPENIMVDTHHQNWILGDWGLSRQFQKSQQRMTQDVCTSWYRPIEILLGVSSYTEKIDMWSMGCILAELVRAQNGLQHAALFPGKSSNDVLFFVFQKLGMPSHNTFKDVHIPYYQGLECPRAVDWPRLLGGCKDLLLCNLISRMLTFNPEDRISAEQALLHPYFTSV